VTQRTALLGLGPNLFERALHRRYLAVPEGGENMAGDGIRYTEEQFVAAGLLLAGALVLRHRIPIWIMLPLLILGMALIFPSDRLLRPMAEWILAAGYLLLPLAITLFGFWIIVRGGRSR
jgi:hypothetical protein